MSAQYKLWSKYTKGVPNNTTRRIFQVLANVSPFRGAVVSRDIGVSISENPRRFRGLQREGVSLGITH